MSCIEADRRFVGEVYAKQGALGGHGVIFDDV